MKILYINGEMGGKALNSHINKIIRGAGGDPAHLQRAFSVFTFIEGDLDYWNLLDENWQSQHSSLWRMILSF